LLYPHARGIPASIAPEGVHEFLRILYHIMGRIWLGWRSRYTFLQVNHDKGGFISVDGKFPHAIHNHHRDSAQYLLVPVGLSTVMIRNI
jgi:hypothetical protein